MVQVPIGGVLKVMVMFPSTGDLMVVIFEPRETSGGNCPTAIVLCSRKQITVKRDAFDEARNDRCADLAGDFNSIGGKDVPSSSTVPMQRDLGKVVYPISQKFSMCRPCLTPAP